MARERESHDGSDLAAAASAEAQKIAASLQNGMHEQQEERKEPLSGAADALRDVAQRVRQRASNAPVPGLDTAAEVATRPLEQGAEYLETHTPMDIWSDTMRFCRAHPAAALGIGFMAGYLFHKLFR